MLKIREADFDSTGDSAAIVDLLAAYAGDPISAAGAEMTDYARRNVVEGLRRHPTSLVLLAEHEGEPVGLAVCFEVFRTFKAKRILNLHDLVVRGDRRGRGVGGALLDATEDHARRRGCDSITLEVIGDNTGAQRLYRRHGFVGGESISPGAAAMFWTKALA